MVLVSATPLAQTASYWAQGGLAAALAADDSFELHLRDTELAGRGLVRRSAAEILVREAPDCVRDLQALGVRFDADRFGRLALGLEGGHSVRRVVHAGGSATGRRVVRQLSALAAEEPRITVLEGARARALWRSRGPLPRAGLRRRARRSPRARVVLATGGAAALWARTTNPPGSQGVGLLLAHAAGAALADLELLQFHPTAVIGVPGREGFLVTEAIRGEGATLHDAARRALRRRARAARRGLARDPGAARGDRASARSGLDMRAIDPAHFPNVVAALREAGLDPTRELIPVAPAAHYMMGGIVTDLDARSTLRRAVRGRRVLVHRACTAPTGSPPTRSASASCSPAAPSPTRSRRAGDPRREPRRGELEALRALPAPPLAERRDARGAVARRRASCARRRA